MKKIKLIDYFPSMGTLVDLSDPETFKETYVEGSKNVPYQKMMMYYKDLLDKKKPYYFVCSKGLHSQKAVAVLEYYGYDVTQVVR